ncbi:MAG: hypothetical protein ACQESR_13040 [Planctomycetota bacterium]
MDQQWSSKPTRDEPSSGADSEARAPSKPGLAAAGSAIVTGVLLLALGVGTYALFQMDSWGDGAGGESERFQFDLAARMSVPAELLTYGRERAREVSLQNPAAIAVGPDGAIFVGGDRAIEVLYPDGSSSITELEYSPTCLTIAAGDTGAKQLYVGAGRHVLVLNEEMDVARQWSAGNSDSILTGIAVSEEDVFVADAGRRMVIHFDAAGNVLGTIGESDPERRMPGFVVPSGYLDLAIGPDNVLHVANPGMRRIEAYDFQGELQSYWGRAGPAWPEFFGCCNPAHLAVMPDGRFVTSEKGLPRIKVYSPLGEFQHVVAGPRQLGVEASALGDARGNQVKRVFDVAIDGADHVVVLDPRRPRVIVFAPEEEGETK